MTHLRSAAHVVASFAAALIIIFGSAYAAAQESAITFPVQELGNCGSKAECHAYSDDLNNVTACIAFAEKHGLMSQDEARESREFARLGGKGPGGCTSKEKCEAYCEDPAHMRECITFAKQAGVMDEDELAEAEKVVAHLEAGGKTPGNCRGERACRAYCEDAAHMEECADFAIKLGFMSEKEAAIFRKTGGTGPGGCKGKACQSFCEDESNREQCIAFALEHDLMSEEDKQRMEEGREKAKEALQKAPPEVLTCIEAAIGADKVAALKNGEGPVSPRLGEVLPDCFRTVMGKGPRPFGAGSDARECMRKIFGEDFEERMQSGEIDPGARDKEIRECMLSERGDGFLNDDGRWQRPENGEQDRRGEMPMRPADMGHDEERNFERRRLFEEEYRERFEGAYENMHQMMDARMREEIEAQMRSGNFDPSRLPPDFRPEGMIPPPESFMRPPEGSGMDGSYQPPSEGFMPPRDSDPSEHTAPPPTDASSPPQSMAQRYVAGVLSVFASLFGL